MMRQKYLRIIFWLFLLTLPFQSAGFIDCTGLADFKPDNENANGLLYVLDNSNDSVYVFEDVDNLSGDQDPVRTISGDNTLIKDPQALAIDSTRDILYVLDAAQDAVLVFTRASELDGDEDVTRSFPIDGNPQSMSYDSSNDRLYVSDVANESILVWDDVSLAADNAGPNRIFDIGYIASTILVDPVNDALYVGDPDLKSVQVYLQPGGSSGTVNPDRSIIKSITNEDDPEDVEEFESIDALAVDTSDNVLFVADGQNEKVDIFESAFFLEGELEPDRQLLGDASLVTDEIKFLLFSDSKLYGVINDNQVAIWGDPDNLEGDIAPTRIINIKSANRIIAIDVDI
ncbi:MAG: hypothetical protein H7A32_02175 [Deltaproteobacteria bacterium]|nr:hypothetical protein [Deltaproteobacteria bacterium]